MPRLQQGSIVWAELPEPSGRRPVLILTRDAALRKLNAVTVAPITRTIRNEKTEVVLEPADGMPTICAVSLENIFTIDRRAVGNLITVISKTRLNQVFAAIRVAFDMP